MVISEKLYTWQEFEAHAELHPDRLLELIDGRIVDKVTNEKHGKLASNILVALVLWAKRTKAKGHYGVDNSYRIPEDEKNERRPDVSFRYSDDEVSEQILETIPDFCVEVKSPSNGYHELRDKARLYLANGAKLVWLVYPQKLLVEVYFADGSSEFFNDDETLNGGEILPDFSMAVSEIFEV
jgi:Uma2 family endonuclease